jgi:shikimate dehydrogenase
MQQAAFDALDLQARYLLWETPPGTLPARIASLRSAEVLGANVTIPYKEAAVPLLDECDPTATRIGAINTIVHRNGRLVGYNTDAPGFLHALAECVGCSFDSHGKKAVILGTGGAARAAAVALLENGAAELTLLGRTAAHIERLLQHLQTLTAQMQPPPRVHGELLTSPAANTFLASADLLVNATPIGRKADDPLLCDVNALPARALVMDMIFNPPLTPLLSAAQTHGCQSLNGLAMLLYQGALAFEKWTARPAPLEIMRRALGLVTEE